MFRAVARRATLLGAASWLIESVKFAAVADVGACRDVATAITAATPRDSNSSGPHQAPPGALKEGTHFSVLSGADGSSSRLGAVAAAMRQADVVLLGEYHDDAVAHALQLALLQHVAGKLGYPAAQAPQQQQQPTPQRKETLKPLSQQQPAAQQDEQQQQQHGPSRPLILSLEMFETDVQGVLTEYLAGLIPLSDLLKDARPWSNYMHDYHHLVEVCKQLKLPVIAANAPRRYVSLAGRAGSEALLQLPANAQQWLPPLPHAPSSEAYVHKVQKSMQQAAAGMDALRKQKQDQQQQEKPGSPQQQSPVPNALLPASGSLAQQLAVQEGSSTESDSKGCPYIGLTVSSNFLAAQSLWDATMAHAIAKALQGQQHQQQHHQGLPGVEPASSAADSSSAGGSSSSSTGDGSSSRPAPQGPLIIHVCGKFHCEDRLGIPEHLAAYAPGAKVLVVVFTPHDNMDMTPEDARLAGLLGSADFVVLTDSSLPRSFTVEHPL